jgi:hypothetical protein
VLAKRRAAAELAALARRSRSDIAARAAFGLTDRPAAGAANARGVGKRTIRASKRCRFRRYLVTGAACELAQCSAILRIGGKLVTVTQRRAVAPLSRNLTFAGQSARPSRAASATELAVAHRLSRGFAKSVANVFRRFAIHRNISSTRSKRTRQSRFGAP